MQRRIFMFVLVLLLCLFSLNFGAVFTAAQEEPPTEPGPETTPVVVVPEATEAPKDPETPVAPTPDTPAPEATPEVPAPTEAPPPTAAPVSAPPVFTFVGENAFAGTAGQPLVLMLSVADDQGVVRVVVDTPASGAVVSLAVTDPVETDPPFNTAVSVTYTAPAEFSGVETLTLTAIDAEGQQTVATLELTIAAPAPESTPEPAAPVLPPTETTVERVINYNPTASEESIQAMLAALGAVELERLPQIGAIRVIIPQAYGETSAALAAVQGSGAAAAAGVLNVEPIYDYTLSYNPNDPLYQGGYQWGLTGSYGVYASNAWDISVRDGAGVTVAVIDSGVDRQHPEFAGKLLPGWDFVNDDNNPDDDNGHGTHVAGVISANTNNATGIAGLAYGARILPVKVCTSGGSCPTYEIAAGIIYAVDNGARVINMSLGGGSISTTIEGAVAYAIARNVTVVAAAGNTYGTSYQYPASYPGVISVAAHAGNGVTADFSTSNDRVTVSAPGVDIMSTVPLEYGSYDDTYSGTSMASPHVAAIAALLIADGVATTPANVREALICSAWDNGPAATVPGYDNDYGWGYVQADWALNWRLNSADCKVVQPNDNVENATLIRSVPFTVTQPVHSRSVTAQPSDPNTCGATPDQTLWYRFVAPTSDYYQFSTMGSSYDTVIGVYQGQPGAWQSRGCSDDWGGFSTAILTLQLQAGQTYYIVVDGFGSGWNDQVLNLDVRRAITVNNVDHQETSLNLSFPGTWAQTALVGASGNAVRSTTDNNAYVVFSFRGQYFDLARVVGPDRGSLEVWVNGAQIDFDDVTAGVQPLNNRAAVTRGNQVMTIFVPSSQPGEINTVVLRRASGGPAGVVDFDRVRAVESSNVPNVAVTAITDNTLGGGQPCASKRFCFSNGVFSNITVPGSHLNTATTTSDVGARITFRATGSAIIIFRNTDPGFGTMDVYVDGVLLGDNVPNNSASGQKVPYVISGLSPMTHVVEIVNNGGVLQFDAAQALTPATLAAGPMINENSAALVYNELWTSTVITGPFGNTYRSSSRSGASATFQFTGNWFCVGYVQHPAGGNVDVYLDGSFYTSFNTSGALGYNYAWCSGLLADQLHRVELRRASGEFRLDYVYPRRQTVITPTMGTVQENNAAIIYDTFYGSWLNFAGMSQGGYRYQGNAARYTSTNGARLRFYVNGTGFILYTSVGPTAGDWEVYVDGVLFPVTYQGVSYNYINLYNGRFRPMGYGITGLTPGLHMIELRAVSIPGGGYVDFDAVRVFP